MLYEVITQIEGIYVPSLYDVIYNEDNIIKEINAKSPAPQKVKKRIINDFDSYNFV